MSRSCKSQWWELKQCITKEACDCFVDDETLADELLLAFRSNIPETLPPTSTPTAPKPTSSPTASRAPTTSPRPTLREDEFQFGRRRLDEDFFNFVDDDDNDGTTTAPTTSPRPTPVPVPTTSAPSPKPNTAEPTGPPTFDPRRDATCPASANAVCEVVNATDCCCRPQLDAYAACAVAFLYPEAVGLSFSCEGTYDCAGIVGMDNDHDGMVGLGYLAEEGDGNSDVAIILAFVLPILLVSFVSAYAIHRRKLSKAFLLPKPVLKKETETGSTMLAINNTDSTSAVCKQQKFDYAVSSMQGWRRTMEDRHIMTSSTDVASSKDDPKLPHNHALFAVFDGHGGEETSDFLEKTLLDTLVQQESFQIYKKSFRESRSQESLRELLGKALEQTFIDLEYELMLHLKGRREIPPTDVERPQAIGVKEEHSSSSVHTLQESPISGSTAAIVLVTPHWMICANLGDSRSVLASLLKEKNSDDNATSSNDLQAIPLSTDHKPSKHSEKERIKERGGIIKDGRVGGSLAVSRAFGDFQQKDYSPLHQHETGAEIIQRQVVSPIPDLTFQAYKRGHDSFVVIACDGIWDVMSNDECVQWINELWMGNPSLHVGKVCEKVLDECIKRKSTDNMTMMIVRFVEEL